MKCEQCVKDGLLSKVTPHGGTKTLMAWTPGYYDEDGKWIANKDPNKVTSHYSCSNGHHWSVTT